MTSTPFPAADTYYPQVPNQVEDDPTPRDQAIYVPAIQPAYAAAVQAGNWTRDLPAGVTPQMLNFLDPANRSFFSISHGLTSAGLAMTQQRDCIVKSRDRRRTLIIGDSGGYQLAHQRLTISGEGDVVAILHWLEQTSDVGMTLDVPTGPVLDPANGYRYATSKDCLDQTLTYLDIFRRNRRNTDFRLLNVLQGNSPTETDEWYNAVRPFQFEGYAFAGVTRNDIHQLCRRLLIMARDGELGRISWIHVLGTADLQTAVCLTAIQRSINRHVNERLRISYDTSNPFRILAQNRAFTLPTFTNKEMTMPTRAIPDDPSFIGVNVRWPWPSPIGNLMTLADICVPRSPSAVSTHDALSTTLLIHHNLAALCWGIAQANRVFDAETVDHNHTIVPDVGTAVEAIEEVIKSQSEVVLAQSRQIFSRLKNAKTYVTNPDDADRA